MPSIEDMMAVAKRFDFGTGDLETPELEIAVKEPCIPFVPSPWNGILVLAESLLVS